MSLIKIYQEKVDNKQLDYDNYQVLAIKLLDKIKIDLEQSNKQTYYSFIIFNILTRSNFWQNILDFFFRSNLQTHNKNSGVYFYSGVGRGKTMLMDLFYSNLKLDTKYKHRVHFHVFMRNIHRELQQVSGVKNPVEYIVNKYYGAYKVLCLDEFLVHDIADAMLLVHILKALFNNNIKLVTTSNTEPDLLYKNGLQRESFLPAIELLNANLSILQLNGAIDYRAKMLLETTCFFYPNNQKNLDKLEQISKKLLGVVTNFKQDKSQIEISNRSIEVITESEGLVWIDFDILCNSARSGNDYIELAEIYKVVILSNLIQLDDSNLDIVRRFINLIDVLYDYKVKLIICAHVKLENIYIGESVQKEFSRTTSRLMEMQTERYMAQRHL